MLTNCRLCGSKELHSIIPLGRQPLANQLLQSEKDLNEFYNLEVLLCKICGLAQLKDIIDPKKLFENYLYFSSNSSTMLTSAKDLVERTSSSLSKESLVIEVASNDGYLLKNYLNRGIKVLGIEPAENISKFANKEGIDTINDFFSNNLVKKLKYQKKFADIIHANNVIAHIPKINDFANGIKTLLKENGIAIIEVPYLLDLIEKLEFDTIYHEHIYYFSVKTLKYLFNRHKLEIYDIEKLEIHGGSLRIFVCHKGIKKPKKIIDRLIKVEKDKRLFELNTYSEFMTKLSKIKKNLKITLKKLKNEGNKIAAYGASAKGAILMSFFDIDNKYIDFIVDKSNHKIGKLSPANKLLIYPTSELKKKKIDYALLLVWNFYKEVIQEQKEFSALGGKFLIPIPKIKIL